jgi:peptide/nickel transport system substrate-binding protein
MFYRSFTRQIGQGMSVVAAVGLLVTACGPGAQPASTSAPAPGPTAAAKATPAGAAQPTTAPGAAQPTTAPAAAQPTTAPAAAGAASIGKPLEDMVRAGGSVKDTIVVAMGQNPDTLHPAIGSMMARTEVLAGLFTYTMRNDNRGEWVPIGVEQVPTIENGGAKFVGDGDDRHLEVTYKIKPGIKWLDGTPTTSKDMAYYWNLYTDPQFEATDRSDVIKVFAVDTPDDRTAVYKYMSAKQARDAAANGFKGLDKELWADYKDQRDPVINPLYFVPAVGTLGWLPEHILSKIAPADHKASEWARNPVGNGPYKLAEWIPEQSLRLEAVDGYFLGKPPTRNVVFRIIADTNATLASLQAGEVDVATQVQGPDVDNSPELDRLQGYKPYYIPGTPWEHIDLNLKDPVLQDKNVRKALMTGINRQEIVDKLLYGKTRVATSWIQPGVPAWAYDENCPTAYKYDVAGASKLLEQAGYAKGGDGIYAKGGQPLKLRLQTTDAPLRKNTAQVIQANLKQIGVDLELEFLPASAFFGKQGPLSQGSFQLGMYTWLSAPDPDVSSLYNSRSIPTAENSYVGQNYPRYSSSKVDELLTKGASELSTDKRKAMYCDAVKTWSDDVPVIPLFQRVVTTTARANMANYRPTPTNTPETWNMWAWFVPAS